ncbi:MAG: hypothetical protein IJ158_07230 [Treponema sp.]|nr:hypothetical protein [Treponema sp.]
MSIEVGQILSLKIKFNHRPGTISSTRHPYLVVGVDSVRNRIEIAQIDSLECKEYKAAFRSNKVVSCDGETVLDKDSYVQLDNKFTIENASDLERFRRQPEKLSNKKLSEVLSAYTSYQCGHSIDSNKCVDMSISEILSWN